MRNPALPALLAILALTGCEAPAPRYPRAAGTAGAPMTSSGELANPNPKPMDGHAVFFAGQIEAEAMLAKSDIAWKTPGSGEGGDRGGGRWGGFNPGGGRRGGGRRAEEPPPPAARSEAPRGPAIRASTAAPVQLRLRLTNRGAAAADVEVLDFNSDLGNFVVQPSRLALAAGTTSEAEPMTSRLGVPAVEEIPVTLRLRVGGAGGRTETQVLELRPRVEEAAAPNPPPNPPAP